MMALTAGKTAYLCVAQSVERKFGELEAVGSKPITETRIVRSESGTLSKEARSFEYG